MRIEALCPTVEVLEGGPALGPGPGPGAVPAAQRVVPRGRHGAALLPAPHQHLNTNMQSTRGQLLYGPQDPPPTCVPSPSLSPGPASRWWPVLSSSWSSCEGDTRQSALYAAAAR